MNCSEQIIWTICKYEMYAKLFGALQKMRKSGKAREKELQMRLLQQTSAPIQPRASPPRFSYSKSLFRSLDIFKVANVVSAALPAFGIPQQALYLFSDYTSI